MYKQLFKSGLPVFLITVIITGLLAQSGCSPVKNDELVSIDTIWAETVPEEGVKTVYDIPLSLGNTQKFIDWYYDIELSSGEEGIRNEALDSLKAPCCDDFTLRTC